MSLPVCQVPARRGADLAVSLKVALVDAGASCFLPPPDLFDLVLPAFLLEIEARNKFFQPEIEIF
jgi:hypothetical protein